MKLLTRIYAIALLGLLALLAALLLLAQQAQRLVAIGRVVIDQAGGDSLAADDHIGHVGESLPADADRERGVLLAAGGVDVADVLVLCPDQERGPGQDDQSEDGSAHEHLVS